MTQRDVLVDRVLFMVIQLRATAFRLVTALEARDLGNGMKTSCERTRVLAKGMCDAITERRPD